MNGITVTIIDDQFAELVHDGVRSNLFASATLTPSSNGTAVVHLKEFALSPGWNRSRANVYFVVPVGYPIARPDTFWTDADLRLASGGTPLNTGNNQAEGVPPNLLWFSWHPSTWNPNHDKLINYAKMIKRRFEELR
jgi:hypothetical protein